MASDEDVKFFPIQFDLHTVASICGARGKYKMAPLRENFVVWLTDKKKEKCHEKKKKKRTQKTKNKQNKTKQKKNTFLANLQIPFPFKNNQYISKANGGPFFLLLRSIQHPPTDGNQDTCPPYPQLYH